VSKLSCILILTFQLIGYRAISQEVQYFHKLEDIISQEPSYTHCYQKIDSIKKTRRPNDSWANVFFNRDVDFGFTHKRLNIVFNGIYYQVNFLLKGDTICFSNVSFDNEFYNNFYKKYNTSFVDTISCLHFLKLRNNFYGSSKNLKDLKDDLILNEDFAFYCGDGNPKTAKGRYIENLVAAKNCSKLIRLLQSISCEEQAYGGWGLNKLIANGYKLSLVNIKLLNHIKERDSEISTCAGCFSNLVKKPSQQN
jgi:hypothetical protein